MGSHQSEQSDPMAEQAESPKETAMPADPSLKVPSPDPSVPSSMEAIVAQLKQDYAQFPAHQTYSLYACDVSFKDPLNAFTGVDRFRQMVEFLGRFFRDVRMDLHRIYQSSPQLITTEWTLHMEAPLPWSPRLSIPGYSELQVNEEGLICSHVDYWRCSRWAVLKQVLG